MNRIEREQKNMIDKKHLTSKSLFIALIAFTSMYLIYLFYTYASYDDYINGKKRDTIIRGASTTTTTEVAVEPYKTRGGIFVPLYKYPNKTDPLAIEYYNKIGNLKVPTIVILNPSSGRDAFNIPSPNWSWAIDKLKNVTMICYIPSGYGTRSLKEGHENLFSWVDAYIDNGWKPDGFHIDEVSSNRDLDHYTQLRDYIKSKNPNLLVSFNPGVIPMESIAMLPDLITIFEKKSSTGAITRPPYMTTANTKRWRAIARDIPKESAIQEMQNMMDNYIYWKYVTDEEEYKYLPTYFDELIQWIKDDPLVNYN